MFGWPLAYPKQTADSALRRLFFNKADLRAICWDENTNWRGVIGLETAVNVPEALKQQLGLMQPGEANET
ncbi:hypothetical protein E1H13_26580 [Nodosilinea sp. P-1105]|nr:hypothetical protein [Nodosilinea sp. P-1105]